MILKNFTNQTTKFLTDNSPAILTAVGAVGVVATAVLTAKSTVKAVEIIKEANAESDRFVEGYPGKREYFELVWKLYIPPFVVGSMSVVSIIFANRIGTRRAAAMTAAYAISERAYSEYREKVVEQIGKNKEQKVRDEIAQDRVKALPQNQHVIVASGSGQQLFMDSVSGRVFSSDMETVKKAQNDTNHEVLSQGYASLSDLYGRLGLPNTKFSDDVGWNSDKLMEMTFSTTMTDDGRSCIVVDFVVAPVRNFFRSH